MLTLTIKQGKEKSLLERQPWVYLSAVARVDGKPGERNKLGATVLVQSSSGQFLARAAYNAKSQISARVWTFDQNESVDHAMIKRRVQTAVLKRKANVNSASKNVSQSISLVSGEEDGLSGLVVDWIKDGSTNDDSKAVNDYLICQFNAAGVDAWKVAIVQALMAETGCPNVYERADELMRKGEGLPVVFGALAGDEPPDEIWLMEKGVRISVDIKTGQRNQSS
ncbi:SAM-dependent methyltransferase [Undibacterium sp. RTI2.1]|uniref:SAM-dependent methyltransferase n=1 Tax=unclassified Undibacterium TaxID=2630295 RepID=UPI002AB5A5B8|nr:MULTISPECIES: SAM-dependent methyltransferase [unclassified Undibacterium]MDY7536773.1 SAM-dependent methyltransferase [Undibacterium sp. 5I1]MEB0029561.1 SAM-dependent methyltransferase [Undibacterium sp. RTI2.1]MEB0115748.1 SAM-dependent methyltransferase [Undibacterium sp. RTI2.2]MEB0231561.1 SAM-dependent methyltransferase [Undibacterium sp. 10I3]MEB0256655.1 SAM-dependent methyltransferase [Undibacterium sp. 5I1]